MKRQGVCRGSGPLTFLAGSAVRQNVDLFILGLLLPIDMIGSYGVARRIMDSSYLSIDAMNRLIYPRFARLSREGIHNAFPDACRVLAAALLLGIVTALSLFVMARYLPLMFGRDYHYLTFFLRCLSGTIIFVAVWSVAVDLIGASGRQGTRALLMNSVNVLGSLAIAAATWASAPVGTLVALYATEIGTAAAAWLILLGLVQRSRDGRSVRPA
jgi:O-antigen/teichoic acid export membrane protein